ncbi:tetratricopeptide repeat protein (plasmid) [Pedobacter sp. BS3]|uniref:tetratricopeptide repeat-containing sensor histidine kinase n=1 Tax=Pedobacter sp. BS3 TaxID=2567937 RepID=UPI0011EECB01|nr:sensor histidine kinase [Pedobacter sp. BS3]TZF86389.1 tetratricopeptide repeat protein [Pedobacter sp. BS3]
MLKSFTFIKGGYLCIALSLIICPAFAQQDTKERFDKIYTQAVKYLLKPDSLIRYANEAYQFAKSENYVSGEAQSLKLKGIYEHRVSNFDQAIQYYQQSLAIFEDLHIPLEIGKVNLNIATSYSSKYDFVKSIQYGLKALKIFEQLNDLNGQGRVLNLLGICSSAQKDYRSAVNYFIQYNKLVKQARDTVEIATSYNNIGTTYQSLSKPDSAIYYLKLAAYLHNKVNNLNGLGAVYENIGALYESKKDLQNAIVYHKKSMDAYKRFGNRKFLSHSYYNLGVAYKQLKDTVKAEQWFDKALDLAEKVGEKQIIQETYARLSELHANRDQYKAAYENLKLSVHSRDSILTNSKMQIIEDLKTKYETGKKEQQIVSLNQQNTIQQLKIRQRTILLLIAVALLLAGVLVAYLFNNWRKLKTEAHLQAEINKQQELATKALLDAEERERRRIATDLHDGIGQILSAALMNMNGLFKKLNLKGDEELQAQRLLSLVTEGYDEMRTISHQMMPNALLKAGLASAVKDFLNHIDENQIKVSLETIGLTQRLDEQVETVLYRIIQETVNNVIKHASASKLTVQIINDTDGISVTVEDNGNGFDSRKFTGNEGIGLKNIHSRVELLKGIIDIDSAPGKGTLVAIHIPLK